MSEAPASVLSDPQYIIASPSFIEQLHLASDRFGIYRERRLLARHLPFVREYRGEEWWLTQ